MDIITEYALAQLHKEGITLDMLTAAIKNIGKVRDYSPTGFIATLIAKRDSSNESSEHAKYKILITPTDDSKLALIKLVKDTFSLGLKEAKDVVDAAPTMIDSDLSLIIFTSHQKMTNLWGVSNMTTK